MSSTRFTEVFIVFVMAVIILMYVKQYYGEVEYVKARADGRKYLMRKMPDRAKAVELMAALNARLTRLVRHMVAKYSDDEDVKRLYQNYNPDALSEGGTEIGYTSYSVNKGEKIVMCLRQRDNSLVDVNTLVYVAVHELGHLMTDEIGHVQQFWDNFRRLLKEAVDIGLYETVDYAAQPQPYCGISISSSVVVASPT
jgi:hypothetical protein